MFCRHRHRCPCLALPIALTILSNRQIVISNGPRIRSSCAKRPGLGPIQLNKTFNNMVVPTGFEPVTYTMSTWCSTPELRNYMWCSSKESNLECYRTKIAVYHLPTRAKQDDVVSPGIEPLFQPRSPIGRPAKIGCKRRLLYSS